MKCIWEGFVFADENTEKLFRWNDDGLLEMDENLAPVITKMNLLNLMGMTKIAKKIKIIIEKED